MAEAPPLIGTEIARVTRDNLFSGWLGRAIRNPDRVLRTEGARDGLDLYVRNEEDLHLFSTLQTRYQAVVGREWDIQPVSEAPRDVDIAEFLKTTLLATNFDACRLNLLRAIHRGYAVVECLWGLNQQGQVIPERFIPRLQRRFVFQEDGTLRLLDRSNPFDGIELPERKFLVHTHDDEEGTRYGSALGKRTHWMIWFKKNALKFWVIFSDKFGTPTVVGKYKPGTEKPQQDLLYEAIESIQQDTGVIIPEDMMLELLEAQRAGSMANYEALLNWLDGQISKGVLGQTLTAQQGEIGSQALGNVHNEVRLEIAKADADALAETINQQLIRWLVDWNFPGVIEYPRYYTVFAEAEDLNQQSQIDERLVGLGLPVAHQYFYDRYSIPAPEAGDTLAVAPAPQPPAFASPAIRTVRLQMAPQRRAAAEMAQQDRTLAVIAANGVARAGQDIASQVSQWLAGQTQLRAVEPGTLQAVFDPASLAESLERGMLMHRLLGQAQVAADEPDATFAAVEPFSLDPLEAIAFFIQKIPLLPSEYRELEDEVRSQAFSLAGAQTIQVVSLIQIALEQALRDGSSFDEFANRAYDIFTEGQGTTPGRAHLENVFRTNLQTAYQVGRYQQMIQVAGRRPYWQYNAVDDNRVRPTHRAQDGKVYRYDHPFWRRWYPPNGFQCRCSVVSLSERELDEFNLSVSRIDAEESPDQGFAVNPAA